METEEIEKLIEVLNDAARLQREILTDFANEGIVIEETKEGTRWFRIKAEVTSGTESK